MPGEIDTIIQLTRKLKNGTEANNGDRRRLWRDVEFDESGMAIGEVLLIKIIIVMMCWPEIGNNNCVPGNFV